MRRLWGGPPGLRGSSRTRSSPAVSEDQQAGVDAGRRTGVLPHEQAPAPQENKRTADKKVVGGSLPSVRVRRFRSQE